MKEAENSIQDRLKQVFDALGITIYQIAKDLDENSSKFYNILSGRAKPSYDTIIGILNYYPQVRSDFLLRGEGPVLTEGDFSNAHPTPQELRGCTVCAGQVSRQFCGKLWRRLPVPGFGFVSGK